MSVQQIFLEIKSEYVIFVKKSIMITNNISLKPYNTFGIEAHAKKFSTFNSIEVLVDLLKKVDKSKLLILGGGSNILFKNEQLDHTVLVNKIKGKEIVDEDENTVSVKVGAGENWHEFVLYALDKNWGGIENLSLIPGSVGASPMQNIGAYGVEIKDVFESLEAISIETGEKHIFNHNDCKFGYRESVFKNIYKNKFIIVNVTYRLTKNNHQINTKYGVIEQELTNMGVENPTIQDVSEAVIAIRQSKLPDPKVIGNAGSFFKNPIIPSDKYKQLLKDFPDMPHYKIDESSVKVPAGWLIDQAGWKGKTFGNFGVHKNQALVLVNYNDAKGEDIYNLSEEILNDIEERYSIRLEREVNIVI